METLLKPTPAHSAEHFGVQRDFWWNRDFLDLMAARWKLSQASSLADIGCGMCHWSRLLYRYLKAPGHFAGVDSEERWVREGRERFLRAFPKVPSDLVSFVHGDAREIPLRDASFEVVTCQTLLMHLGQPLEALKEMYRILRPGGLLICVEPNNLWNYMAFTSLTANEPIETVVRRFEFWLRYQRGLFAAGKGNHSIGDLLPGLFTQLGLTEIKVWQSDRVPAIYPPYDTPAQQALLEEERQARHAGIGCWNRDELREAVQDGGGSEEFFETVFGELNDKFLHEQQAIASRKFHSGGGSVLYLVSGRKR